jgi:hypothetical protein
MDDKIDLNGIYAKSSDIVSREIEGELILVPLVEGIGDLEEELFTLNTTGRAIWEGLDGNKTVQSIIEDLLQVYEVTKEELEEDVTGLMTELLKRKVVVKA